MNCHFEGVTTEKSPGPEKDSHTIRNDIHVLLH